jgi:hypothetical protein
MWKSFTNNDKDDDDYVDDVDVERKEKKDEEVHHGLYVSQNASMMINSGLEGLIARI